MARPLVIYHAACADGFTAAWIAWRFFAGEADFHPAQYGEAPPDVTDRHVFILDFSWKKPAMAQIYADCQKLVVLDHHETAQAELEGFGGPRATVVFDLKKSGARLAWEYFFPGVDAPLLVEYVEDRDLWRWALPSSREFNATVASYEKTFEAWEDLLVAAVHGSNRLLVEGTAILRYQGQQVESLCRGARECVIGGHRVLATNAPVLQSEVAGKLAEGRDFGAAYFLTKEGKVVFSLRRRDGSDFKVNDVARLYGGGGHPAAAGFTVSPDQLVQESDTYWQIRT